MDSEIQRKLEEIHALAKDNHDMLRALRRHQWYSLIWTIVVWVIVLVAPLYLYQQYVQPLVEKFYVSDTSSNGFSLPTSADVQKLINSFTAKP